jgi:lipopolysaccharide export system protein LptA
MRRFGLAFAFAIFSLMLAQDVPSSDSQQPATEQPNTTEQPASTKEQPASTDATTERVEFVKPDKPVGSMTIKRSQNRTIIVSLYAPSEEGGEFRLNVPECEKDLRLSTIYAPKPYIVETQVNEAVITSQVALSRRPPNKENAEGKIIERGSDKEKLELVGGTLKVNQETLCPEDIKRSEQADVTLKQGRTTIKGLNFLYDNNKGIGNMKGPITLDRVVEGDSPALNATSDTMEVNVDDDKTFLEGNVKVTSEDRVSEAATLEYNEDDSIAILRGDSEKGILAKSTKGSDTLQGDVIIYYLDTNDVVVQGNLQGDIEVDLEDSQASGQTDTSNTAGQTNEPPADGGTNPNP